MLVILLPLQALYAVSHRCPTVARLLLIAFISPLRDVAQTPDCGILYIIILSRRRFRHPIGPYLCSVEFQADYRRFPFLLTRYANFIYCALRN